MRLVACPSCKTHLDVTASGAAEVTCPCGRGSSPRRAIGRGEMTGDALLWSPGMTTWTPARQLPEVASLFPPPAPPV